MTENLTNYKGQQENDYNNQLIAIQNDVVAQINYGYNVPSIINGHIISDRKQQDLSDYMEDYIEVLREWGTIKITSIFYSPKLSIA